MKQFKLPDPGEGLVEAEIITWRVAAGDQVKINDVLVEIETSKSLVELPSPFAGTVTELLVPEGETVDVGTPIITIDDGSGDQVEAAAPAGEDEGGEDQGGEEKVPNLVGYGSSTGRTKRRARKGPKEPEAVEAARQVTGVYDTSSPVGHHTDEAASLPPNRSMPSGAQLPPTAPQPVPQSGVAPVAAPAPGVGASGAGSSSETGSNGERPLTALAKPPVRKLAKDLGLDLRSIQGTGANGIVTRKDVQAAAEAASAAPTAAGAVPAARRDGVEQRIPVKGVRKATAQAMVSSAFTAPHVSEWVEIDVTASMELLDRLRARREFAEVKLSPTLLVARAVCLAVARHPEINASWDEAAQEIVLHPHLNLGIAAATPRGLVVPNVKGAEQLSLLELATALGELISVAKQGRTQPAELAGGTLSITNVGVFGVDGGTPILPPGESMIVCTGQISRRPWVVGTGADERLEVRSVMTLACSFDHRLIDGEQGSKFLADVAALLSDPGLAML